MYKRYKEMTDSLDYVVVIAGHNDASLLDSIGIDNYKEKLGILCEGLIEKYPSAAVFLYLLDTENFSGSAAGESRGCDIRGVRALQYSCFDAAHGNIFAQSDAFRKIYFQNEGLNDTAHLNAKGHDRFFALCGSFFASILIKHLSFCI